MYSSVLGVGVFDARWLLLWVGVNATITKIQSSVLEEKARHDLCATGRTRPNT